MAVGADLGHRRHLEEIEPVPERRQRVSALRIGVGFVERGRERAHRKRCGEILHGPAAADPFGEVLQRHGVVSVSGAATLAPAVRGGKSAAAPLYTAQKAQIGAAMTTFDDREKAFEKKFEHDQELQFKVNVRKNKLLGLWAAGLMGKRGEEAEAYAK